MIKMEIPSSITNLSLHVICILFNVFLSQMGFFRLCDINKIFSRICFLITSKLGFKACACESSEEAEDVSICREEAEMVMGKLGFSFELELEDRLGSEEFIGVFDEEEPSIEEVKGAFDVFDENRDGFIDEMELQRVLCALGLKEGCDVVSCKRMIRKFDRNGDGRIDFSEFVKLMENGLW